MAENKKALGKGLSALISDATMMMVRNNSTQLNQGSLAASESIIEIEVEKLEPNADQPRGDINPKGIEELSQSIKKHGILQPLLVQRVNIENYIIIAGERRWRAAMRAGLTRVPAIVKNITLETVAEIAIIENIQREDLKPLEEARAYRRLIDEFGYTQENLSSRLSKSRVYITNMLRLLKLPSALHTMVNNNELSAGHARALINSADPEKLAACVIKENLTVRETEKMARESKPGYSASVKVRTPEDFDILMENAFRSHETDRDILQLERLIASKLQSEVKVIVTHKNHYLLLKSDGMELLDKILTLLDHNKS